MPKISKTHQKIMKIWFQHFIFILRYIIIYQYYVFKFSIPNSKFYVRKKFAQKRSRCEILVKLSWWTFFEDILWFFCKIHQAELGISLFSLTLNIHNFFHNEPILKIFDVLKSYVSETFISGVYVVRGQDLPPPPIANVKRFSAKSQNPDTKWSAPP